MALIKSNVKGVNLHVIVVGTEFITKKDLLDCASFREHLQPRADELKKDPSLIDNVRRKLGF